MQLSNRSLIQAVALFHSARNVIVHIPAAKLQTVPEDACSGDTIDVIVAVDGDPPFLLQCPDNRLRSRLNSWQQRRIIQVTQFGVQECFRRLSFGHAPRDQNLSQQGGNLQLARQPPNYGGIVRVKRPFSGHALRAPQESQSVFSRTSRQAGRCHQQTVQSPVFREWSVRGWPLQKHPAPPAAQSHPAKSDHHSSARTSELPPG
jgi:hypothetical protein